MFPKYDKEQCMKWMLLKKNIFYMLSLFFFNKIRRLGDRSKTLAFEFWRTWLLENSCTLALSSLNNTSESWEDALSAKILLNIKCHLWSDNSLYAPGLREIMTPTQDWNLTGEGQQENELESITLKCRWLLEGILLPSVGCIGTIGKHTIKIFSNCTMHQ